MGRVDEVVARLVVLALPVVFEHAPDAGALWVPDDEAGADLVVNGEQVEFAAENAVVAAAGLLQAVQVVVQRVLGLPRGAVYALQHGPVLVATPVGAGDAQQLEGGDGPGGLDVRADAQVLEVAVAVGGYRLFLGYLVDDFELQGLFGVHRQAVLARVLAVHERQVTPDDLLHAALDLRQVVVREWLRGEKVVVEAVLGGRPDGQLCVRVNGRNHVRHHVSGGMADTLPQISQLRVLH